MKRCAVEWRPQRLPTATFSPLMSERIPSGTRASWKTISASPSNRAARTVRRSGAPGPAPTRWTVPLIAPARRKTGTDHVFRRQRSYNDLGTGKTWSVPVFSLRSPAEERQGPLDRRLVGLAEVVERGERLFRVLAVAQQESVEAAAFQVEEVVAPDLAHGAQLAPVAVALAQQPRDREAAAVAELGEVHFDARDAAEPLRDRRQIVGRLDAQHLALLRRRRALGRDPAPFDERCHKRVP